MSTPTSEVVLTPADVVTVLRAGSEWEAHYRTRALLWSLLTEQVLPEQARRAIHQRDLVALDDLVFSD